MLFRKAKWSHFTMKEIFLNLEHHAFFEQPASSTSMLINYLFELVKIPLQLFGQLSC